MFSPLRNRFGIPGVISVIAFVFAMFGGAYAASNNGGGKATASAKGKPGPRGPRGKTGPAGPAGPTGPTGPQGAAGANGKDGANGLDGEDGKAGKEGAKGKDGKDGTSVANTEFAGAEGTCTEGGTKLVGTATTYACNGKEGSPWTAAGTLPSGKTETGTWAMGRLTVATPQVFVPISFPIPLAAELDEEHVHYINSAGKEPIPFEEPAEPVHCGSGIGPGVNATNPQADPGHLCVYASAEEGLSSFFPLGLPSNVGHESGAKGASVAGASVTFFESKESAFAYGTWAVTAP